VKAGLRAYEIARLDGSMVLDARSQISGFIEVRDGIAKKHGGRHIPIWRLKRAVAKLKGRRIATGRHPFGARWR